MKSHFPTPAAGAVGIIEGGTAQEFADFLRGETARYARLVKEANLKIE